jgi:hypothetical protein
MNFIENFLQANDLSINEPFHIEGDKNTYSFDDKYELTVQVNDRLGRADSSILSAILIGNRKINKLAKRVEDLCDGDLFYAIDDFCNVLALSYGENHSRNKHFGNAFMTEEEANKWLRGQIIDTELKNLGGRRDLAKPRGVIGYIVVFNYVKRCFVVSKKKVYLPLGTYWFNTEEEAQNAIQTIGEDTLRELYGLEKKRMYRKG